MGVEVRTIVDDEVPAWIEAVRVGFLGHATDGEAEYRRPSLDLDRTYGAFDGERVVGTLRSFPTDLTVPGGVVSCSGLTNVTVTGTHRRQGLLTRMITRDLAESAERGEVVGSLIAAEYPIYGRFGYGPAVEATDLVIDARAPFLDPAPPGSVEMVDRVELRRHAPGIYESARQSRPGAIARDDRRWDMVLSVVPVPGFPEKLPRFFVLGRDATGTPDGYLTYQVEERWENARPVGTLRIEELVGRDPSSVHRLWQYALGVDWIATVEADDRAVDELLPWLLTDARLIAHKSRGDLEWVRVLDAPAALAARRYLAPGRVVLEIEDPLGHADGRFALEGGPDGAECRATTESADLALSVSTLSAAYLGGYPIDVLAKAGRVEELTPGSVATADAMFRSPVAPWCMTHF